MLHQKNMLVRLANFILISILLSACGGNSGGENNGGGSSQTGSSTPVLFSYIDFELSEFNIEAIPNTCQSNPIIYFNSGRQTSNSWSLEFYNSYDTLVRGSGFAASVYNFTMVTNSGSTMPTLKTYGGGGSIYIEDDKGLWVFYAADAHPIYGPLLNLIQLG